MTYANCKNGQSPLMQRGWLADRSPEFREALMRFAVRRSLVANEMLYHFGDEPDGLYGVLSGTLKVTIPADNGQEITAHRVGPGFWIGDLAMLSGGRRLVTVSTTSEAEVLFISTPRIFQLVEVNPRFYADFYVLSNKNMETALRILANLAVDETRQRLVLRLLHLDEVAQDADGWIIVSQQELAGMIAISLPTLQRALHELEAAGQIELGYRKLRLQDRAGLLKSVQS